MEAVTAGAVTIGTTTAGTATTSTAVKIKCYECWRKQKVLQLE